MSESSAHPPYGSQYAFAPRYPRSHVALIKGGTVRRVPRIDGWEAVVESVAVSRRPVVYHNWLDWLSRRLLRRSAKRSRLPALSF